MKSLIFLLLSLSAMLLKGVSADAFETKNYLFTGDITWASKYMIDGFNVGGDKPVFQLAAKTDHLPTGLSLMLWTSIQADRKNKQYDEQDVFLMYSRDLLKEKRYALNLHGYYDYWIFPNTEPTRDDFGRITSTVKEHGDKFQLGFSMPRLFPLFDSYLVPTYNAYYMFYWERDRKDLDRSGTSHQFQLEYFRPIRIFIPGANYQYAGGKLGTHYYDGAFDVKAGITHSTASFDTGVYALNSIFIASLNYQWTYEEQVNESDEFWTTFSYVKKY